MDLATHLELLIEARFINSTFYEIIDIERELDENEVISNLEEELAPPLFQPIFLDVKQNLKQGEIYVSHIYLDRENLTHPVITFATPIYDDANQFRGVLALTFQVQPIFDQIVARMREIVSSRIDLTLTDTNGTYLFNTREPRWTSPENGGNGVTFLDLNPEIPDHFFEHRKDYVKTGGMFSFAGKIYVHTPLDIDFSDDDFSLHLVLSVPSFVLLSDVYSLLLSAIGFIILAGILGAVGTVLAAEYGLVRPLERLRGHAKRLSEGDLRIAPELITTRGDELGQLQNQFHQMVENLRELLSTITESNDLVTSISEKVFSQAEEVTAAAEEVATSMQNVTQGASAQAEKVTQVNVQLQELGELIKRVIAVIQANARQISEIAQLTRILSLNATIEASRAGQDAGGFMVIAETIQNLAAESKKAVTTINSVAKEINEKLPGTFEAVNNEMSEMISISEETVALAEEVSASIADVIHVMEDMTELSQVLANQAAKAAEVSSKFKVSSSVTGKK